MQNRIVFRSSETNWWTSPSNGVRVAISNVLVGSLGDYGPVSNVWDIGPHLDAATNFPGDNCGEDKSFGVDYTNVFYQLIIPSIWITPRQAYAVVGGSNVQYEVTGTNISTNGISWTITPDGLTSGAVIQASNDWHYAGVTPGTVATNYKIRATSKDNTNFYDEVNLTVKAVDIFQSNIYVGAGSSNVSLYLTPESSTNVQWEITPSVQGGASIQGGSVGTSIVVNAGSVPTNYTVRAYAVNCTNCYDTCTVTVLSMVVTNIKFNWDANSSVSDAINIRQNYSDTYDISNGEWVKGGTNIPACYTTNKAVTIKARFTVQPASITSAYIWAVSTDSGGSLGNIVKTKVTFVSGVASDVVFWISGTTPNSVKKTTADVWQWKVENINGSSSAACDLNTSGVHTVYTILAEPVTPWDNTVGSQKNAWTKVLDYSCNWAAAESSEYNVVAKITTNAYSEFGKTKTYRGQDSLTKGNFCRLTELIATNKVDCRDMSAVVQLFTRILGGATVQVRRVDGGVTGFYYKRILPIGGSTWTNGLWNFHQFGWQAGSVNDACVKLKELAPYVPVHDDLNGNYKTNLYDSGTWNPLAPDTITDFD